ncbi:MULTISPECIES: OprD family outer membrane porin [unclassified Pseudomonas]|uniref:OprD family outer membrane porin n=1 Tax=unclassified Pseudomonas TaxID=196821 RepID=UPI002AC98504|nr:MULTISPECIES: OprD family outer membrane porin [unclassified Pseudomonas]MEB0039277.1 OprD family outer membrane porin [Pseudomonas sp. MH10]MEB0076073.1 OprD family outer membrane porin [Pseudomonas sp. MH10out]MEB0090821.1 OprD family outer membrane porin [Pseudomonas sp. CCI4.2]MEB0100126.1 OprD family outer membrane porin [Pseudomonas sp. CCI3.2]MEB0119716.1 OprD family outer membrane porin [Pseudomonas sp. CCI1.2]
MHSKSLSAALALTSLTVGLGLTATARADFIEDSKLSLGMRNFFFNSDNHSGGADQKEWAQGFKLDYISGFTEGPVGFGLDVQGMLGLHLDGGKGMHPAVNTFTPSKSDGSAESTWASAGATAKARFSKTEFRYGNTLTPALPILLANDGRLQLQTFEGGMITSKDIDNLTLTGGQIEGVKGRASTNSTGLSVSGATQDSNKFLFAGGDWKVNKDLTLQYYYANMENFYSQNFLGLVHVLPITDDSSFKTDLRYFKSTSDGRNGESGYAFNNNGGYAKNAGKVDNTTWSTMFTYSLGNQSLMLGRTQVSDDGGFVWNNDASETNQYGKNEGQGGYSFYLFNDATVGSFARAGEATNFGQYSYNFAGLGIAGLKASVSYLRGADIRAADGHGADQHESEIDTRVDYVVQTGPLKGFGTTLRHGTYHAGNTGSADLDQTRLFFNYTYNFF